MQTVSLLKRLESPVLSYDLQCEAQLMLFSLARWAASWTGFIPVALANRAARAVNTIELACILQILILVGRFDDKWIAHRVVAAIHIAHSIRGIDGLIPVIVIF
jgi:hypothetical protein